MVNTAALRRTNKSNTGNNCKTAPDNSTSPIIDNLLHQYSTLYWFIERFSDNSAFLTLTGLTLIFASSQFALFPLLNILTYYCANQFQPRAYPPFTGQTPGNWKKNGQMPGPAGNFHCQMPHLFPAHSPIMYFQIPIIKRSFRKRLLWVSIFMSVSLSACIRLKSERQIIWTLSCYLVEFGSATLVYVRVCGVCGARVRVIQ